MEEPLLVACVGGANVDIVGTAGGPLLAGDSTPGAITTVPGGVARNVAEALACFGIRTALVTVVGGDANGDFLLDSARASGIDMDHAIRDPNGTTPAYLTICGPDGELQNAVNDMQLLENLGPNEIGRRQGMLADAAVVVADANLRSDTLQAIADMRIQAPLFVDGVSAAKAPRVTRILPSIDTLKVTREEAASLMSAEDPGLDAIGSWFRAKGVDNLFVTLGDGGVYFRTEQDEGTRSVEQSGTAVVRTGGAGDAFLAGLVYGRLQDYALDQALDFAMAAARLVVGRMENVPAGLTTARVAALL